MSMGPMKKRMVFSFLIGFLVMLVIAGALAIVFYKSYSDLKTRLANAEQHFTAVYVAKQDFIANSGQELNKESFELREINTNTLPNEYYKAIEQSQANNFKDANANNLDVHTLLWPKDKKVYPKIDIPKGTIITMDMLWDETEKVTSDTREQEYNMILLPSLLKENDYVDIRLLLPTGNDFIVSSCKRVKKVTEGTVWFDLNEIDTQYISSAIIEACLTKGAMLYAVKYSEPTLQEKSEVTYAVLDAVSEILFRDISGPNAPLLNQLKANQVVNREIIKNNIIGYKETDSEKERELIVEKVEERIQKQQEERQQQIAEGLLINGSMDNTNMNNGEVIE